MLRLLALRPAFLRLLPMVPSLAWTCVVAIAVLSLLPGGDRPHTGLPGRAEHFIAYAGTGFLFALGYSDLRHRFMAWAGLAIASCVFEVLQNFVPGRSPSPLDALASTSGLTLGLVLGAILSGMILGHARPEGDVDLAR